ncbi:hypothetical protein GCM10027592_03640 [Spirosoma flavus]
MVGTGYELQKALYAEVDQNQHMQLHCKPYHLSLYTWICELRNRTKREVLDLPVLYTMQMTFIGSQHTLAKAIDNLADWGIIDILTRTKGYGTKVKLANAFLQKHCNSDAIRPGDAIAETQLPCNTTAIAVQTTKTNKRRKTNKTTSPPQSPQRVEVNQLLSSFRYKSEAFITAWQDWEKFRRELKKPITPTTVAQQLKVLAQYSEIEAIAMIEQSICQGWQGLFELKTDIRYRSVTPSLAIDSPRPQQLAEIR